MEVILVQSARAVAIHSQYIGAETARMAPFGAQSACLFGTTRRLYIRYKEVIIFDSLKTVQLTWLCIDVERVIFPEVHTEGTRFSRSAWTPPWPVLPNLRDGMQGFCRYRHEWNPPGEC